MKNDGFSQRKALPDRYFTMKEVSAIMQADEAQIKSWIEVDRLHIVHFDNLYSGRRACHPVSISWARVIQEWPADAAPAAQSPFNHSG